MTESRQWDASVRVRPEQYQDFVARLHQCENVAKPLRYMSHFGCADELDKSTTVDQT